MYATPHPKKKEYSGRSLTPNASCGETTVGKSYFLHALILAVRCGNMMVDSKYLCHHAMQWATVAIHKFMFVPMWLKGGWRGKGS